MRARGRRPPALSGPRLCHPRSAGEPDKPAPCSSSLVFAFLYVPIAVLVALSFNEGGLPTVWSGFSTKWYVSLASNAEILSAALNTLIVALVSTAIATLLGTLLAIGVETRRKQEPRAGGADLRADDHSRHRAGDRAPLLLLHARRHAGPAHHHPRPRRLQPRLRLHGGARPAEILRLVDRGSLGRSRRIRPSPPSGA